MALKPCPNCAWMLNDTEASCNMCGASTNFPGARAAAPPAPPPAVPGAGAYAPPGPAPAYPQPAARPPGPAMGYGGAAPPPPMNPGQFGAPQGGQFGGYATPPPVPAAAQAGGAYSAAPGAEAVSPWALAAQKAQPVAPPPQAAGPPPPPAPPAPIANAAYALGGNPGQFGGAPAPGAASFQAGGVAPPPPQMSQGGAIAPPGLVGAPGPVAPPPFMSGGGAPGGMAMPPIVKPGAVTPPPVMPIGMPGGMPGAAPAPGSRVLVGFLVTFQNDQNGSFWPIHSGRLQMGRGNQASEGVDVALPDPSASSRHASIYADPATGQAYVEDDGSRNGTFLNEQRIPPGERRQLRDSDRLRIGSTTFVVKLLVS